MQKEMQQLEFQKQAVQAQTTVANAEMGKAQATLQVGQMKAQIEAQKSQAAAQIDALEAQIKALEASKEDDFKRMQLQTNAALELTKLEVQAKKDLSQQNEDNKAPVQAVPAASSK
jgi:hypothetical protein